jgi:hypothetical protein
MSNARPTHAPCFSRSHDEPEPNVFRTGPLDETERLAPAPPPHEPSSPQYRGQGIDSRPPGQR